jgi:5'-3' exonuclease
MGINGLMAYIRQKTPAAIATGVPLASLHGLVVAVDLTLYAFRFKAATPTDWPNLLLKFLLVLRSVGIHPYTFVDHNVTQSKLATQQKRVAARQKVKDTCAELADTIAALPDPAGDTAVEMRAKLDRLQTRTTSLSVQDRNIMRAIADVCGCPIFLAAGEAETYASRLARAKLADAVMSDDSDCLAYNPGLVVRNINMTTMAADVILDADVHAGLGMSAATFGAFAIMLGTDYNERIPKCGPVKAHALLAACGGTIEGIGAAADAAAAANPAQPPRKKTKSPASIAAGVDITLLNHTVAHDIFTAPLADDEALDMAYLPAPDVPAIRLFMSQHGLYLPGWLLPMLRPNITWLEH